MKIRKNANYFSPKKRHLNLRDANEKVVVYSVEKDENVTANLYEVTEQIERPVFINIEHLKEQKAELEQKLCDLQDIINQVEELENQRNR